MIQPRHQHTQRTAPLDSSESGNALVWALMFMVVSTGMIVAHSSYLASSRKERDARYDRSAMSSTFADSGAQDALAWFRRQPLQPVPRFAPKFEPGASPPIFDTVDPTIGLVREFQVHGSLWCRYEIRHEDANDVTALRDPTLPTGSAWELGARSYVYRLNDPQKSFDEAPNQLVATGRVDTEIRGIPVTPPGQGAVIVEDRNKLTVELAGILDGGAGRPYITAGAAALVGVIGGINPLATVGGGLPPIVVPSLDTTVRSMFGMELEELRRFADVVADPTDVPTNLKDQVIYIPGDVTLPAGSDFEGVVMVVDGDLNIVSPVPSVFRGTMYIKNRLFMDSPGSEILGTVIVGELLLRQGAIRYDASRVSGAAEKAQQYRASRSRRRGQ